MKNKTLTSIVFCVFVLIASFSWAVIVPARAHAQTTPTGSGSEICDNGIDDDGDNLVDGKDPECYVLLEPLPGLTAVNTSQGLAPYITILFRLAIGIAGVIAVVVIVIAGITTMTSETPFVKGKAKDRIMDALIGLLLLLGAVVILNTINPDLLNVSLKLSPVSYDIQDEVGGDLMGSVPTNVTTPSGVDYPRAGGPDAIGDIARSSVGHITYRFGAKGGPAPYPSDTKTCDQVPCKDFCPPGTLCFDCSGYINYVLQGAGMPTISGGTSSFFNDGEKITSIQNVTTGGSVVTYVNNKALRPGDILGWAAGENGQSTGHVVMYIGNGQSAEASAGDSGRSSGKAVKIGADITKKYVRNNKQLFTSVKRM